MRGAGEDSLSLRFALPKSIPSCSSRPLENQMLSDRTECLHYMATGPLRPVFAWLLMTGSRAGGLSLWTIMLCGVTSRASLMRETAQQVVSQSVFYDAHSTRLFDPQGRVLQLEYAQEATKKGGAAVGAVCGDLGVIASWTPRVSQRQCKASEQPTRGIWSGDSHVALAGSGMVTDALVLVDLVRKECLSHRYIFDSPVRISRLMSSLQKEMYDTERTRIIPYAVDLIVCGSDQCGTFLYNIGPSSVYESYRAYAVGNNADVAKSFLATRLDELGEETRLRDLVSVALKALVKTFPSSTQDLKPGVRPAAAGDEVTEDISLAVVGKNIPVTQLKVSWDSATRRLDVSLPPGLAEM